MVTTTAQARLLIPANRRPSRERLVATQPFFLRDIAQIPEDSAPRILSFATDDFIDDFLAAAGQSRRLPALLPWRDWCEPPDGLVDAFGAPRYPATIERRPPQADELEMGAGSDLDADGIPRGPVTGAATAAPAWLRKLYLPLHERFNLLAFDVVCGAAGWPRLARSRVKAAGAVVRRLVAAPTDEHWEDWIAIDDKHGAWIEVLDASLRPSPGADPADPAGLPALAGRAEVALRAVLALANDAPLPVVALSSAPLTLLPPNAGDAAEHCTLFGYLPVFSSAREVSAERLSVDSIAAIAARMVERTSERLDRLFQTSGTLRTAAATPLRALLDLTVLPDRPSVAETGGANALIVGLQASRPVGLGDPDKALAEGVDLALRQALSCLWRLATATGTTISDIAGNVHSGSALWTASGADAAASTAGLFASLPDSSLLPGNQTADWLAASVAASPGSWNVLLRIRLHRLVDAWLAGAALPPPTLGQSTLIGEDELATLCLIALLRLRACRLALAASINRTLFGDERQGELLAIGADGQLELGIAALGEQVDAVLMQEAGRGEVRSTPPWPIVEFSEIGDASRVKAVHLAGEELARIYAGFDAGLAAAGGAAVAQRTLALASSATRLAALTPAPSFTAIGLTLAEQPACGLLVLPGFRFSTSTLDDFRDAAAASYSNQPYTLALAEARATDAMPRLRFDAEHLYAVWAWVRIAGRTPCEPERILWTRRSEPVSIADPSDLLGARPASIQMPDIPKLLRDIPRIARSRARPFAGVAAPPASGVKVGGAMADTRRDFGIGMICNFGIPILTICALILFNIIFQILIKLPGFGWMLLLKFCLPFPKRGP